ncbi:hypothetical protein BN946_scf185015.g163 [Trametes cinnabarina]|uniref:Uncharacterized protein n=1 Tax=Pycnoporus cinnabarinus TaxID=5643 RepID=A0A060SNR2_PYCCI|nr:hypothetical protein BN946_scf185015.g163 [Trametes cinnabarina]
MATMHRQLHPVHINHSSYSSLANAVSGAVMPPHSRPHKKHQPAIRRTAVPTAPARASGGFLRWPFNTVVVFERTAPSCDGDRGVSFSDIKQGRYDLIRNSGEPAFMNCSQASLEFKILWPGYHHLDWHCTIDLVLAHGRPMTRFEFARSIVGAYERFFERARRARYGGPGKENTKGSWDLSGDLSRYDFALKAVHNRDGHESVFQAEVEIISYC